MSMITRIRLAWISSRHDFRASRPAYISPGARFDFTSDGYSLGGRIFLGRGARIAHGATLAPYGGSIDIGDNVFIGPYCVLYGHGGLTIGNNVLIAAHTIIIPANHTFTQLDRLIAEQPVEAKGIVIEDNVWIAGGARILDGLMIGSGSIVGAGAVVTRSVPRNAIVGGVPAKVLNYRSVAMPSQPSETVLQSFERTTD